MKNNVPQLRFPEFREEWEKTIIGEISQIGNGKDYKHLKHGNIPVYGSGGYMTSVNEYLHEGESIGIGRKGTIDKPIFLRGKFWTVDTLFYTYSFHKVKPKFLYLIFQRINWKKYNEASGVPSLSKRNIEKINICIPSLPEQNKIATFLGKVDLRISLLEKKKEELDCYKKGIMQHIFSQTIRFKDDSGKSFPNWERKKLGEILNYTQPSNYLVSNTRYKNKYSIPVLTAGKTFLLGFTNDKTGIFNNIPAIIFDDFTTDFKLVNFKFAEFNLQMQLNFGL